MFGFNAFKAALSRVTAGLNELADLLHAGNARLRLQIEEREPAMIEGDANEPAANGHPKRLAKAKG